ncbi:MAG: hypothetical protein U0414_33590 [Polyangiaceae bacterium]
MRHQRTLLTALFTLSVMGSPLSCAESRATPAPSAARSSQPAVARRGYAELLADLDKRIDKLRAAADGRPTDWLIRQNLAALLFDRAGLTNRVEDFGRVQAVLDESFALAPKGAGPLSLAARFNYSIHRLTVAEGYLDQMDKLAIQKPDEKVSAWVMRGQIALQRGQYDVALQHLSNGEKAPADGVELALYHAKTGDPVRAEALLQEALKTTDTVDPRRRAWLRVQLGLLALNRGALPEAMERFQAADDELPGWWFVQEQIAQVHELLEEHDDAIAIYEDLVRTDGLPQHIDALAAAYVHRKQQDKADPLIEQAGKLWDAQLAEFPDAAMGHGLQHALLFGTPERALELAQANVAVRPGGDAQVGLAKALLKAAKPAEALEVALRTLATPYRTAALHDVAAQAYEALGQTDNAKEQYRLCYEMNPRYSRLQHTH